MGGHGGLNILPQKRWNVYNFDNREKVRKDEEAAAKDEQLKREQSRKHDTEIRLQQIRQAKGISQQPPIQEKQESSKHINLFEGIKILDPSKVDVVSKSELVLGNELRRGFKKMKKEAEVAKVVLPEDEKYRLGYGVHYVKEMAKELVRNYLVEARWLKEGYMPTLEEYMSVSMVTGTYGLMIARSYVGRDDIVTEDAFKWVSSYPPIIKASCVIVRLMDDIVSHKEEQERGHVASSIECYSKESGASEEEACEYISKKVEDAWKVINRELLRPTPVPFPLLMPAINLARMCEVLYSVNDGFTHAEGDMKSYMKSFFVHPMVI